MTNVSVNNNPKLIISQRSLLFVLLGAALLSTLSLYGTAHYRTDFATPAVPGPDVLYSPFMMDSHAVSILRDLEQLHDHAFPSGGGGASSRFNLRAALLTQPQFSVHESDDAVKVTVHVPETVRREEIEVQVHEGSILYIRGGHNDKYTQVSFEKTFALGRHMDADSITASLSQKGILTVTAPKIAQKDIDTIRKIDITKTEF
uniref:SHSP domain-containing protein n=1 Tax=Amphora coffeiformis TaxID=265554 RepID=A0A7S3LC26_9STRA|mmetsp:Transcript_6395/g.12397  ORF Transcript_6395/g.12397 Transcript_6395/m.12397 type:complete len:203 (-) Transcript_6395:1141-1749(-)|eukprot:scaffold24022_cov168-Amphora_coffeaeformis.AAC.9